MVRVQQLSELEEVCPDIICNFIFCFNHEINHNMGEFICFSNRSLIIVHFLMEARLLKGGEPLFAICGMTAYKE
jgi:hypothetical protein